MQKSDTSHFLKDDVSRSSENRICVSRPAVLMQPKWY